MVRRKPAAKVVKRVRWWPRGRMIPRGWRVAAHAVTHHTRYAVLIEKKGKEGNP